MMREGGRSSALLLVVGLALLAVMPSAWAEEPSSHSSNMVQERKSSLGEADKKALEKEADAEEADISIFRKKDKLNPREKMIRYLKRIYRQMREAKEKDPEWNVLPSGVMFKVLAEGTGQKSPTLHESCRVHYTGKLLSGTVFDCSRQRNAPATFAPSQVIKGWTEVMQLMREGDRWQVLIPPELAYGVEGNPPKIPVYSFLDFDMELIEVVSGGKPADEAKANLKAALGKSTEEHGDL